MLTRNRLISGLHCSNIYCDVVLTEHELEYYDSLEGMCEKCYSESMQAAYDDWEIE